MKKIFLPLFLIAAVHALGQLKMQGTLKPGATTNTVDIYLMPSISFAARDEAMTFVLAVPATALPAPSIGTSGVTANGTGPVAGITGLRPNVVVNNLGCPQREVVTSQETINGTLHYVYTFIFAGTAGAVHNWTAGTEQLLFSIAFEGCTSNCDFSSVKLVNLPSGGTGQIAYWYFQANTVSDLTNYASPFYANVNTASLVNGGSNNGSRLSLTQAGVPTTTVALRKPDMAVAENNLEREQNSIKVYPNPAKGKVNILLPQSLSNAKIRVLDAAGKTVLIQGSGNRNRTLDVKGLAAGVYTVQIIGPGNAVKNVKVVLE
jgi:hypothetical protein